MDLEAARALVPWWVFPVGVLAHAGAAFLGSFALGALLFRFARRADALREPWPIRARALYPARVAILVASSSVPIALGVALSIVRHDFLGGKDVVALSAAVAAAAGLVFWRRRLTRLLGGGGWTARRSLAGALTRALVLYPLLWATVGFAVAMPARFDATSAVLFGSATVTLLLLLRGAGFRVACALGLAPPAPPEIAQAVAAAATAAGIPLKGVHRIDLPEANAYALPFDARIGFTSAALGKLDRASLLAVAQHEVTHLSESARARRTRAASLLVLAPVLVLKPLYGTGGFTAVLLGLLLSLLMAKLLRGRLTALETRADAGAKGAEPETGVYARALTEIYRLNLVPAVMRGTIHPHLYDRLVALGAPPAYPRPRPPSRRAGFGLMGLVTACALVLGLWASFVPFVCDRPWVLVAFDGGAVWTVGDLALARHKAGLYDEAATLYGAAAALRPWSPRWPAYQSMSLAAAGRIGDARRALAEAERRGADPALIADARSRIERRR